MEKFLTLKIEDKSVRKLMLIIAKFVILAAHIGLFLLLYAGKFFIINGKSSDVVSTLEYIIELFESTDPFAVISGLGIFVMFVVLIVAIMVTLIRLIISVVYAIVSTVKANDEEKNIKGFKTVTNQFQKSFFSVLSLIIVSLLVDNTVIEHLIGYVIAFFAICFITRIITLLASGTRVVTAIADFGLKALQFLAVGSLVILFTRVEFSDMINGLKVIITSVIDFDGLSVDSVIGYILQYLAAPIVFLLVLPFAKSALDAMFNAKIDEARKSKRSAYSISLLVMVCIYIGFMFASASVADRVDIMFMPRIKYYIAMLLFAVAYLILIRIRNIDSIIPNPNAALEAALVADEVSAEEAPAEEAPAEEAPAEEAPVEEVLAEETPAEEAPAEEAPAEEAPAEEAPAEEAPAEEAPAEEAPVEEVPAEETPAEEAPVEEAPTGDAPAEEASEEVKTNE